MQIAVLAPTYSDEIFLQFFHGLISTRRRLLSAGVDVEFTLLDNNNLPSGVNYLGDGGELLRIAGRAEFSGIVMLGGILSFLDDGTLPLFVNEAFEGKPLVNVMARIRGVPSITTDNAHGIAQLVDHLVEFHGYRRIAMINGMPGHPDSKPRFDSFVDRMAHHGLEIDHGWIRDGLYSVASGQEVADEWLTARRRGAVLPEAVIAANDDMAYGFIRRFNEYRSQNDVSFVMPAVCGFDNRDFCMSITPAITTVTQPVYSMADTALSMLVDHLLNGTKLPMQVKVAPELVVRESCGCGTTTDRAEVARTESGHFREMVEKTEKAIRYFLHESGETSTGDILYHQMEPVITEAIDTMGPENLHFVVGEVAERLLAEPGTRRESETVLKRRLVGDLVRRVDQYIRQKNVRLRDTSLRIQSLQESMRSATTNQEIRSILASSAPVFGLKNVVMVLDSTLCPECPVGELCMTGLDGTVTYLPRDALITTELLTEPVEHNRVITGLQNRGEGFGYLVCDVESEYVIEVREIARSIGTRLVELQRTRKLLEAERYSGLANLLHGFSHHVNTPLGISVTATSAVESELRALRSTGEPILPEELDRIEDAVEVMSRNVGAMRRMVELFERLSAVSDYSHWSFGDPNMLVAAIVEAERPRVERAGVVFTTECAAGRGEIPFPRDMVRFVLAELLDNSISHAFPTGLVPDPAISLSIGRRRGRVVLDYSDNGVGLPADRASDPFAPFSRRGRRDEGMGLGLFAVKRIVQDILNGEVQLAGAVREGFRLRLAFPIPPGRPETL